MKKIIIASVLSLTSISAVYADDAAGLFVEPFVTYERGRGEVNFPSPFTPGDTEVDGFGIGARFGGHVWESVFVAVDGRYSMPTFKDDKLNQDTDAKSWNAGPVVGVQMPTPIGLRVWGGYIVAGELDPDKDKGVDEKFIGGSGYRVGAGMKLGPVSLNVEYQNITYDRTQIQEVGVFTPNVTRSNIELENEAMVLSVSFPVTI